MRVLGNRYNEKWCANCLNAATGIAGLQGTHSAAAVSFLNWGTAVGVNDIEVGDVAVFGFSGGGHHVGVCAGYDKEGHILVLGGNQHGEVCISAFDRSSIIGGRRPPASGDNAIVTAKTDKPAQTCQTLPHHGCTGFYGSRGDDVHEYFLVAK